MRIGIDAIRLVGGYTGVYRAISGILRALQTVDQRNDYYLYSKYDFDFRLENPRWRKRIHPKIPFFLGGLYLKNELNGGNGLDVFWVTRTYAFPFGLPPSVAKVMTVYDLVWRLYPETMTFGNRIAFKVLAERGIRQADKIIAISGSTRQGLIDLLSTPRDRIEVVPLGVDSSFEPHDGVQSARLIAEKYGVSPDYICTVGTVEPRKNMSTLVEAVRILRDRNQLRHQLLIAGTPGWKNSDTYASVERCGLTEREVKFLGHVPDEDLSLLYSGAALFVFPSRYEGFGLPLLEAMASAAPVVAANTSSIPEVVGEAAIMVSPDRPEEFAEAIARVTGDPALSRALSEKGLKRAQEFTWEAAALKVLRIFEESVRATAPLPAR